METKQVKIKTAVSLPENAAVLYRMRRDQLLAQMALFDFTESHPARDRARCYNRGVDAVTIVQVYWLLEVYNKLHAVAAALRVSVSLLVYWMLLIFAEKGESRKEKFSNYSMIIKSWSKNSLHIEEKIQFFPVEPDQDDDDDDGDIPLAA